MPTENQELGWPQHMSPTGLPLNPMECGIFRLVRLVSSVLLLLAKIVHRQRPNRLVLAYNLLALYIRGYLDLILPDL